MVVAVTAIALVTLPPPAPTASRYDAGTLVMSVGTLIDGTDREPLTGATIIARDGRVAEIDAIRQIEIVIRDGRVVWRR